MRNALNAVVDRRWNDYPFGHTPHATREEYQSLFEQARSTHCPFIDDLERQTGYAIDKDWLDSLALHTQIVKKRSPLFYHHGRLLYLLLRDLIHRQGLQSVSVLETGTARGFSAICLSRAIADAGIEGRVISVDVLPHFRRQIWNCIDDLDAPKSRAELLAPWAAYLERCVFLQGDSRLLLPRINVERIHFAFLDAQHIEASVMHEFTRVAERQCPGDMILFDDVTDDVFPGVAKAVRKIAAGTQYDVQTMGDTGSRGFATAQRC